MKMHIKKPDIKGTVEKLKHLNKEDIKAYKKARSERRERILEERKNRPFAKKMRPVYKWMNRTSLLCHFMLACLINFGIEAISRHSLLEAVDYMTGTPMVFLYNAFMIFVTFSIVYLFKRRVFVRIIISALWIALGVANGYMLMKRVTPFNAQDLKAFTEGLSLVSNYFSGIELILLIVGLTSAITWIVSMWRRGAQYEGKIRYPLSIAVIALSAVAYYFAAQAAVTQRVVSTYFGNIAFAYEDYGLPYCFMASVFNTGIDKPSDYKAETIQALDENQSLTSAKTGKKYQKPNIIVIQLESFFDVDEAEFFETSADALPNLHKLFKDYSSGYFKVPSVGAGTANTEFEVLTGMNMRFFGPGEYPYKTKLKHETCESAATALAALGYGTHGLHNNGGNFYSRARVYDHMGFDSFTSKEFMNILQLTPIGWAKDEVLVDNIVDALDSTEGQDFVFGVSVQGHGNYPAEKLIANPKITVEGIESEETTNKWEYYVNMVYEMDEFVGNLVETLEERDEPTVCVFYGDHLPTMGLTVEDLKSRYLYNTNYVIWDNIGLKEKDKNLASYQLMAEVFDRCGIHSGTVFNYHQQREGTTNYLSDLEILQYDILYGSGYIYGSGEPPITEGHMVMGVRDVTLEKLVEHLGSEYSLYGENFTQSSKVFVNGEKVSSRFLNNTRIDIPNHPLQDGDVISVRQMGSSNTLFRKSDDYIYADGKLQCQEGTATDKTISWTLQEGK
ncbi:MAG: sulfatase-like hydrolase/transferase [Dorea sp.]|nr:sulfatase-like hydrolase/transferase [Dorea sp.]